MSGDLVKVSATGKPLPCPFCGGESLRGGGDDKVVGYWCLNCQATGPNHYGRYEWNDRAYRIEELEAKLATARQDALKEAAEVCTNIIRDYDVVKPNGTTYEPVRVQRAAKGMVSLAREDIRALIAQEEPTT